MQLPKLPKQNKQKEADLGLVFREWWLTHQMEGEFELKDTRGKPSLAFSEVSHDQEVIARLAMSKRGVLVRRASGTTGMADYSGLVSVDYYLVVRYPEFWCIIPFEDFIQERDKSKRKSLTSEKAKEISTIVVPLLHRSP